MKTTLLIMAAGIGSRYGGGIKQLAAVGPGGEIIMDYSIHDAIEAGFDKIVFIIRKDIEADFRQVIGDRVEAVCRQHGVEVAYAFQSLDALPDGFTAPPQRTKPWGTGQAVLAAKEHVDGPFAVINADDYYGKSAFKQVRDFLLSDAGDNAYCMAGFLLKNTLSDNGSVTRGLCQVSADGYLSDVVETHNISKVAGGASANNVALDGDRPVSMNMWGLTTGYIKLLEADFVKFLTNLDDPLKSEYLLPVHIGQLLNQQCISVKVLPTPDKWFGITYKEDMESVVESFHHLIEDGVYSRDLYSDLR